MSNTNTNDNLRNRIDPQHIQQIDDIIAALQRAFAGDDKA
jgi:hypothetical protein